MPNLPSVPAAAPTPFRPCKVLVVDDHPVVRAAMARFFETHDAFRVADAVADGDAALAVCARQDVDVVLLDCDLGPDTRDGFQLARALRRRYRHVRLVMFSADQHELTVQQAFRHGADAFYWKGLEPSGIAQVILHVCGRWPSRPQPGDLAFEARYRAIEIDQPTALCGFEGDSDGNGGGNGGGGASGAGRARGAGRVTQRERQVLRELLLGRSIAEIAVRQGRSPHTIQSQRRSAFRKLGIAGQTALFARREAVEAMLDE